MFPQKEFGVFIEPPKNEKIGHRKSGFTDIEKEVTEHVIKTQVSNVFEEISLIFAFNSREETATLLAEFQSNEEVRLGGSNSQLNTGQLLQIYQDGQKDTSFSENNFFLPSIIAD